MNIESIYVKTTQIGAAANIVRTHLQEKSPSIGSQVDAPLPSSFDQLLLNEKKRKIVVSPPLGEWCYIIESKEVVDFALAQKLSEQLHTTVLIIQVSTVTGACGNAIYEDGKILASDFSENDDSPEDTILRLLSGNRVISEPLMFKEAVQNQKNGWLLISKKHSDN